MHNFLNGVNPSEVLNNQNIFYKNPTHLDEASRAIQQSDIVRAIRQTQTEKKRMVITYKDNNQNILFPGVPKIKNLIKQENGEDLQKLFHSILRSRPNIYSFRISLGEYKNLSQVRTKNVLNLGSTSYIDNVEVAKRISSIFMDQKRIVDLVYYIEKTASSNYLSSAAVFETTEEEYEDNSIFNPIVEMEYVGMF